MFIVEWFEEARDDLQKIYDDHRDDSTSIVYAHRRLYFELSHNALGLGESRDEFRRIVFIPPPIASFEVDDVHSRARILWIHHMKAT